MTSSSLGIVVDDRYKTVWGIEDGLVELYEHARDPLELHDISGALPDVVHERIARGSLVLDLEGYPSRAH